MRNTRTMLNNLPTSCEVKSSRAYQRWHELTAESQPISRSRKPDLALEKRYPPDPAQARPASLPQQRPVANVAPHMRVDAAEQDSATAGQTSNKRVQVLPEMPANQKCQY